MTTRDQLQIWWDMGVYTTTKVKHNKPDIMLWKKEEKTCELVECTVPLDTNLADKRDKIYTTHFGAPEDVPWIQIFCSHYHNWSIGSSP